jgi:F-type H+-transporting ATPase subunit b
MATAPFLATTGLLNINGTLIVQLVAFILMVLILAKWVYPPVARAAERRQRQIGEQLEAAKKEREEAEQTLKQAQGQLNEARGQASDIIAGANKSADQLRAEMRQRADEESRRIAENARRDIEAERQKAIESVRGEVAGLVAAATEKVIGESVDDDRHRRLIEQAIRQVGTPGENGARRDR